MASAYERLNYFQIYIQIISLPHDTLPTKNIFITLLVHDCNVEQLLNFKLSAPHRFNVILLTFKISKNGNLLDTNFLTLEMRFLGLRRGHYF